MQNFKNFDDAISGLSRIETYCIETKLTLVAPGLVLLFLKLLTIINKKQLTKNKTINKKLTPGLVLFILKTINDY